MKTTHLILAGVVLYLVLKPDKAEASTGTQQPAGASGSSEGSAWLSFAKSFLDTVNVGIKAATQKDAQPQANP